MGWCGGEGVPIYKLVCNKRLVFSPIPLLSNGTCFMQLRGGEQKRATKNRTPLARGAIEPFLYNGFP